MSNRNHRNGGKFGGGKHTTFIELAGVMADVANDCPESPRSRRDSSRPVRGAAEAGTA